MWDVVNYIFVCLKLERGSCIRILTLYTYQTSTNLATCVRCNYVLITS